MKLERLTQTEIKRDLNALIANEQTRKRRSAYCMLVSALLMGAMALLVGVCCLFGPVLWGAIIIACAVVCIAVSLVCLLFYMRKVSRIASLKRQWIECEQYRIVGDTLERARMDDRHRSDSGSDLLEFARHGSYYIPLITHYEWSKDCHLSPRGMFNTSIVGDRFYLVIFTQDPKKKIMMIYNTKFFKLDGDDPFDYENFS